MGRGGAERERNWIMEGRVGRGGGKKKERRRKKREKILNFQPAA